MATVTSPIITDTTGQDIVDGLSALASAVKPNAVNIPYSNTSSGLSANDVQGAIDEVNNNINNLVKKSTVSLTFDSSGRATIFLGMGRIIAVDFKTTSYTYTLRYLSSAQTLIYLRNPNTLALVTNESNAIVTDIYYI